MVLRAPPTGGWSGVIQILLPCAPERRRKCFVTESAGRPFKTHDDAEALFVGCQGVEGQSTNRDKGSGGWSSSAFSSGWWMVASHQAALRPRGRRGLGHAFGVSCLLPAPACLAGDLGCQRPFCLYKQSGPGARSGLTQRSVVSAPGWQGGPGSPEFANPLTPLLPGRTFASLSGPAPVPGTAPKTPDPQLLGLATAESSPGWVKNVSVGRFAKGLRHSVFSLGSSSPVYLFFKNRVFQGLPRVGHFRHIHSVGLRLGSGEDFFGRWQVASLRGDNYSQRPPSLVAHQVGQSAACRHGSRQSVGSGLEGASWPVSGLFDSQLSV